VLRPCHAVFFVKIRVVAGKIRTANPTVQGSLVLSLLLGLDSCEEDVIVACWLYLLSEEEKIEKRKQVRTQNFPVGGGGMTVSLYIICFILKNML
jgi:hypothetical protein